MRGGQPRCHAGNGCTVEGVTRSPHALHRRLLVRCARQQHDLRLHHVYREAALGAILLQEPELLLQAVCCGGEEGHVICVQQRGHWLPC